MPPIVAGRPSRTRHLGAARLGVKLHHRRNNRASSTRGHRPQRAATPTPAPAPSAPPSGGITGIRRRRRPAVSRVTSRCSASATYVATESMSPLPDRLHLAHGSGSDRFGPRGRQVAEGLRQAGCDTLLIPNAHGAGRCPAPAVTGGRQAVAISGVSVTQGWVTPESQGGDGHDRWETQGSAAWCRALAVVCGEPTSPDELPGVGALRPDVPNLAAAPPCPTHGAACPPRRGARRGTTRPACGQGQRCGHRVCDRFVVHLPLPRGLDRPHGHQIRLPLRYRPRGPRRTRPSEAIPPPARVSCARRSPAHTRSAAHAQSAQRPQARPGTARDTSLPTTNSTPPAAEPSPIVTHPATDRHGAAMT